MDHPWPTFPDHQEERRKSHPHIITEEASQAPSDFKVPNVAEDPLDDISFDPSIPSIMDERCRCSRCDPNRTPVRLSPVTLRSDTASAGTESDSDTSEPEPRSYYGRETKTTQLLSKDYRENIARKKSMLQSGQVETTIWTQLERRGAVEQSKKRPEEEKVAKAEETIYWLNPEWTKGPSTDDEHVSKQTDRPEPMSRHDKVYMTFATPVNIDARREAVKEHIKTADADLREQMLSQPNWLAAESLRKSVAAKKLDVPAVLREDKTTSTKEDEEEKAKSKAIQKLKDLWSGEDIIMKKKEQEERTRQMRYQASEALRKKTEKRIAAAEKAAYEAIKLGLERKSRDEEQGKRTEMLSFEEAKARIVANRQQRELEEEQAASEKVQQVLAKQEALAKQQALSKQHERESKPKETSDLSKKIEEVAKNASILSQKIEELSMKEKNKKTVQDEAKNSPDPPKAEIGDQEVKSDESDDDKADLEDVDLHSEDSEEWDTMGRDMEDLRREEGWVDVRM